MGSSGRRGRRSRIVCSRCHEKKIRCDLQRPGATCSNCATEGALCEYRPSHKGQRAKRPKSDISAAAPEHLTAAPPDQHQPTPSPPTNAVPITNIRALLGHQAQIHSPEQALKHWSNIFGVQHAGTTPQLAPEDFPPGVLSTYLDTYFKSCYVWCSVLDPIESKDASPNVKIPLLLQHAIASVASTIRPPLLHSMSSSQDHYERARHLFHAARRIGGLTLLRAAMLLSYSNNPVLGSPTDSSFWWTGMAIRLAQDLHLHCKPRNGATTEKYGMRRRMWWTLYARERMVALCQGRPCIIDEKECNVEPPQPSDFPLNQSFLAEIFVHWVHLGRVMGQVQEQKLHAHHSGERLPTSIIATSLTTWFRTLPATVQLSISGAETTTFNRDVHLLHLPYLTSVALTYLDTSGYELPQISIAAVLAATSIARIFKDFLLRGSILGMPEDAGWYIAIAITALSYLCPIQTFEAHARADICILLTALEHMSTAWTSSKVLLAGLKKFLDSAQRSLSTNSSAAEHQSLNVFTDDGNTFFPGGRGLFDLKASDGIYWSDLFPFASADTSPLFKALIMETHESFEPANVYPDSAELLEVLWEEITTEHPEWFSETY